MTFNEADVNREHNGRFGHKNGSAPSVSLADRYDALTSDLSQGEREAGLAIGARFAPDSNLIPVKVFAPEAANGYRVGLLEQNGAVYYQYEADADGMPLDLIISGTPEPQDSEAFRAAEAAAQGTRLRPAH